MDKLINTLPAILRASGNSEEVTEVACKAAWNNAVGEGLRAHAVPVQFTNSTLVVAVADGIWKRQLEQMCGQLLFRLNSVLGQPLVKSIELRVDPNVLSERASDAKPERTDAYAIPIELLSAAAWIEDTELRRAFLGAAMSCVKRLENSRSEI